MFSFYTPSEGDLHSTGTSDPYVSVILNGERIYKTETKKKSLAPAWNEDFTVEVYSRADAKFTIEVVNRLRHHSVNRSHPF